MYWELSKHVVKPLTVYPSDADVGWFFEKGLDLPVPCKTGLELEMIITNTERKNGYTIIRMQDQETLFRSWMVLRDGFAWKCGTGSISFVIDPDTDSVVGFVEWPVCEITNALAIGPIYDQVIDIYWNTNWEESDFVEWIAEGNTILNKGCPDQEREIYIPDEDSPF